MAQKITKKGALSVTAQLDQFANLVTTEFQTLGIPERIAADFAHRCDLLSDAVEKQAGINRSALSEDDVVKEPGFNPEEIGAEKAGPETADADESFMKGHFTQQSNRELRERVQDGDLGATPNPEPQSPTPGKQARQNTLNQMLREATLNQSPRTAKAIALAMKIAEEEDEAKAKEDVKDEGKKAAKGEIPPQFVENAKKKQEEAAEKKDDKKEEKKDDKAEKKAHNFNLYA